MSGHTHWQTCPKLDDGDDDDDDDNDDDDDDDDKTVPVDTFFPFCIFIFHGDTVSKDSMYQHVLFVNPSFAMILGARATRTGPSQAAVWTSVFWVGWMTGHSNMWCEDGKFTRDDGIW